jgi:hypothetical protein
MIEIYFTPVVSDEEDDLYDGSNQQRKSPGVKLSNAVYPATVLAVLGDKSEEQTKTQYEDLSSGP